MTREEMLGWLQDHCKEKRYRHTLGVEETASAMAERFGENPAKAALAGLLHDSARWMDIETMREYAVRGGAALDDINRDSTALLHAPAGVELARTVFSVTDEDILNAIRWHTTGTVPMSGLAKILYIADIIEPNRDEFPGMAELRALAAEDLDAAMKEALQRSYIYLTQKNAPIHPDTLRALRMANEGESL